MSGPKPLRRLRFGLATILGIKKLGYFIPHRYAGSVTAPEKYTALEAMFDAARPRFEDILKAAEGYVGGLTDFARSPQPCPRWRQAWFPRLDALAAYTIIRTLKPRHVVEIGAGHSTRFIGLAAIDEGAGTRIEAIDPFPRADFDHYASVTQHRTFLHEVPGDFWDIIGPGDVVSLDGSHILMPGTDVDLFLGDILPRVAGRAILHIHDICLPDPYPDEWAWRGYNEQTAVAGLIGSGAFDILWSSRYVATRMKQRVTQSQIRALPLMEGVFETSLWLVPKGLLHAPAGGKGTKASTGHGAADETDPLQTGSA